MKALVRARACARPFEHEIPCLRGPWRPRLEQHHHTPVSFLQRSRRQKGRGFATPTGQTSLKPEADGRERVVILGSGWAGYVLSQKLDTSKYQVLVVSPRSYFVFTPLLNDSAVGTLEFRNVLESLRKRNNRIEFLQGWADDLNFADKTVTVEPSVLDQNVGSALISQRQPDEHKDAPPHPPPSFQLGGTGQAGGTGTSQVPTFPLHYDKLIIAVGCYSQTFNTKGVKENALFLKDVNDARRIRRRILDLFELAKMPFLSKETKKHLLHFAIVGGGPTGMEFAACLSDLIRDDLSKMYPDLMKYIRISLYDVAPKVLPMFDKSLSDYAVKQYKRQNVDIKTSHHVVELRKGLPNDPEAKRNQKDQVKHRVYTIETKEEGEVGIGMCVWSTGNQSNPFVAKALDHVRRYPGASAQILEGEVSDPMKRQWIIQRDPKTGLILVDDHFRIQLQTQTKPDEGDDKPSPITTDNTAARAIMQDVWAIGDTTILKSGRLPGTAQVANQQALWLSGKLNKFPDPTQFAAAGGFGFKNLGVMTYLGGAKAVLQAPSDKGGQTRGIKGWVAYLIWRGAYLTMTLSWRNKFLVPIQWLAVKIFGRDVSRF